MAAIVPRAPVGWTAMCDDPDMELTFLGGARTVTGSRHLVDTGRARVLIDCGMFQGGGDETMRNRVPLGVDPTTLDAVVLTHAHLDHCGLLPLLVHEGFRGAIVCTAATAELARLVLLDSAKLQVEFAKRAARRARHDPDRAAHDAAKSERQYEEVLHLAAEGAESPGGPDPEELLRASGPEVILHLGDPLYTEDDVDLTLSMFQTVPYGQEREVAQGIHITLADAGHILGSAMVRMRITRPTGGRDTIVVFSGDLGRPGTPILRDPTPMSEADVVLCESTYGDREHEPAGRVDLDPRRRRQRDRPPKRRAADPVVRDRAHAGDRVGAEPAARCRKDPPDPRLPRLTDGEVGIRGLPRPPRGVRRGDGEAAGRPRGAARLPRAAHRPEHAGVREDRPGAAAARDHRVERDAHRRPVGWPCGAAARRPVRDDPVRRATRARARSAVTSSAGAQTARIAGHEMQIRATIKSLDGFSAHADEPELLAWLGGFIGGRRAGDPGVPRDVYLVHGDPPAQAALAPKVDALGLHAEIPAWHQTVSLD